MDAKILVDLMRLPIDEHALTGLKYFNERRFCDNLRQLKRIERKAERAYRKHSNLTNRLIYREKLADSKLSFATKKDESTLKLTALKDLLGTN